MSWSPDIYIGELRPWPDSVHVVRGNSGETRRYTPERKDVQEALERRIDELCAEVERLRKYTQTLESANLDVTARLQDYIGQYDPTDAFVAEVKAENAKLREFLQDLADHIKSDDGCGLDRGWLLDRLRELGIEVDG